MILFMLLTGTNKPGILPVWPFGLRPKDTERDTPLGILDFNFQSNKLSFHPSLTPALPL